MLWAPCADGFVRWERCLIVSQFTREEQPPISGSKEALAMVVVALRLRELLFGDRAALRRCEHYTTPVTLRGRRHNEYRGSESVQNCTHFAPNPATCALETSQQASPVVQFCTDDTVQMCHVFRNVQPFGIFLEPSKRIWSAGE
jgi:hypothetical protein